MFCEGLKLGLTSLCSGVLPSGCELPTGIPGAPVNVFNPFETAVGAKFDSVLGSPWLVLDLGSKAVSDAISSGVKTPGNPAMPANCACVNIGLLLEFALGFATELERLSFNPIEVGIPDCGG